MTDKNRCEPPPEFAETLAPSGKYVVHVPDDAGGIQWRGIRYRLSALTPPATVAALVEALERIDDLACDASEDHPVALSNPRIQAMNGELAKIIKAARAALALHRGETGR